MLRRCHTSNWPRSLVLELSPASILSPLLSLFNFKTSKPSLLSPAFWRESIQAGIRSTRPAEHPAIRTYSHGKSHNINTNCGQPQQQPKMDSMPIRSIPVPSLDALKISEPGTKVQHVEQVNAPANVEHHEYLPKGLHQTNEEKASHWFIGSIDCGTTSSRFLIFDGEGTPISNHQIEFENIYPESG